MEQIVSREVMFNRGAEAARHGLSRDGHNMNWFSPAIPDWQAGHDYVTKARQQHARGQARRAEP
ncbi:hypothetical protein [Massilia sp. METH4]|uniref:hypothetical protein n=1 Tax=Massilia sp. METH4 TaxID=3123041 RepID=UPI0030D00EC5